MKIKDGDLAETSDEDEQDDRPAVRRTPRERKKTENNESSGSAGTRPQSSSLDETNESAGEGTL